MDHWTLRTVGADRVVAHIEGDLDLANGNDLIDYITMLVGEWECRVEVDLSGVGFIDSSGLKALLSAHRLCSERRAELVLVDPSEPVARLFELTGCTHIFTISDRENLPTTGGTGQWCTLKRSARSTWTATL